MVEERPLESEEETMLAWELFNAVGIAIVAAAMVPDEVEDVVEDVVEVLDNTVVDIVAAGVET